MHRPSFPAKQRDDFELVGTCALPAGTWSVKCQARTQAGPGGPWELSATLGAPVDGETPIELKATSAMTSAWPPGQLVADVKFSDAATGRVVHTGKFVIDVESTITA